MGRFSRQLEGGWYLAVPFLQRVAYDIDTREQTLRIQPSTCVTKDNVSVTLDGVVFVQIVDAKKAAYGAAQPYLAVLQHAQSIMRTAIGRRTLDEAFHDRVKLNADIREGIESSAANWGMQVLRYEVLEISPDRAVAAAMDLQATAERRRREKVTTAEASKEAAVLEAEGRAQATERAAEADKRAAVLRAEADAESVVLAANAARQATELAAQAEARSLSLVAEALSAPEGKRAAGLELAREYVRMMGEGMSRSNTLMLTGGGPGGPVSDFDASIARAVVMAGTAARAIDRAAGSSMQAAAGDTRGAEAASPDEERLASHDAEPGSEFGQPRSFVPEASAAAGQDDEIDELLENARRSVDAEMDIKRQLLRRDERS